MTMIFKAKFYALVLALLMTVTPVFAKTVTVEVTGNGANKQAAINNGIKQAIAQVTGVTISSEDLVTLKNDNTSLGFGKKGLDIQKFKQETQSNFSSKINGYVSGYSILNSYKEKGNYEVNLSVSIEKYEVPGMKNNRRGIAVIGFKANSATCLGKKISSEQQIDEVSRALVNAFTTTRKFSVLDRDNEDVYSIEKNLILDKDTQLLEKAKLGQVKGTDYIITGLVKNLRVSSHKQKMVLTGDTFTTYSATASVDFKLLAFATRQVKFASSVKVNLSSAEISGKNCVDIISLLMEKVALQIVNKCIENIYPPRIVNINNNKIYLNIGGENIKKGSLYDVYKIGEKIIDPYTGESLGSEEVQIGTLRISEVKPKYSIGLLEKGKIEEIKKGQICRYNSSRKKTSVKSQKKKVKISEDEW